MKRIIQRSSRRLLSAVVLLCGLLTTGYAQVQEGKKPEVELKSFEIKAVKLSEMTVETVVSMAIKNPGPAFRLQDLTYRLTLNEQKIAAGAYEKEVTVAAAAETVVELPFTVELTKVPGVAWNAASDSFTLRYELETEFTIPLFANLKHTQKSSFKGDFPIPDAITALPAWVKEKLFGKP